MKAQEEERLKKEQGQSEAEMKLMEEQGKEGANEMQTVQPASQNGAVGGKKEDVVR